MPLDNDNVLSGATGNTFDGENIGDKPVTLTISDINKKTFDNDGKLDTVLVFSFAEDDRTINVPQKKNGEKMVSLIEAVGTTKASEMVGRKVSLVKAFTKNPQGKKVAAVRFAAADKDAF